MLFIKLAREKEIRALGAQRGLSDQIIDRAVEFGSSRILERSGQLPDPATALRAAVDEDEDINKSAPPVEGKSEPKKSKNDLRMESFFETQKKIEKEMGIG